MHLTIVQAFLLGLICTGILVDVSVHVFGRSVLASPLVEVAAPLARVYLPRVLRAARLIEFLGTGLLLFFFNDGLSGWLGWFVGALIVGMSLFRPENFYIGGRRHRLIADGAVSSADMEVLGGILRQYTLDPYTGLVQIEAFTDGEFCKNGHLLGRIVVYIDKQLELKCHNLPTVMNHLGQIGRLGPKSDWFGKVSYGLNEGRLMTTPQVYIAPSSE